MKKTHITLAVLATAVTVVSASQAVNAQLVISQNSNSTTIVQAPTTATSTTTDTKTISTQGANYTLDPAHANVRFAIDHYGTTTNQGGFYGVTGDLQFNPAKQTGAIDVIIPISTLKTGNEHFDNHLKTADFFNIEKYPTAEFKSTKFYFDGEKVSKVTGNLTMLGKTNPVTLTATKFNCYLSPILKAQVCGGDFETTIDRTQWGMSKYVLMGMSKNVKLNIQVEASKK